MREVLDRGWTLRAIGGVVPDAVSGADVPATVPGCVHVDLLSAGLIPDPLLDENEALVAWIARVDWQYRTHFDWVADPDAPEVDIVAAGLDTVATIELNGVIVAQTRNMHRSYRVPIAEHLRDGTNDLRVSFRSALDAAEQFSVDLGPRPATVEHPINAIRKMACNFGADWGPELITAGVWRPLAVESWGRARIASVRPLVEIDPVTGNGILRAHVDIVRAFGWAEPVQVGLGVAGVVVEATVGADVSHVVVEAVIEHVRVWWPNGWGEQPLYPVIVSLHQGGSEVDTWTRRIGFRTVTVDTVPDDHGTPFTFVVNGEPLFVRGVNWIPDDPFPARVDRSRYRAKLTQARDLHANTVRVWGGGVYESEDFYDVCDELGLMVWQDFAFNCACYAEEDPLRGEIVAEAREAVTRLSCHPSLVLWNGCNENLWGYEDWNWKASLGDLTWGAGYYFDLLPAIVTELDPTKAYLPGSPYSMSRTRHPLDPAHGTTHIWDVWNERDYTAYRDYVPRFCSEFGFQGPPTWATLTAAIHDEPLDVDSPGVLAHEKAVDGMGKLARGLRTHLPDPATFADWHWATSLNQARAIAYGVEHFRSWMPVCMGSIVWQLNDCWPVISWSAIDGGGRRKPMWYALRHSYADRLLTIQPRPHGLSLVAVNDSSRPWRDTARLTRLGFDGVPAAEADRPFEVAPRSAVTIALPDDVVTPEDPGGELIVATAARQRAWWQFAEDVDARLPEASFDATVDAVDTGYRLTVTAHTLIRDLALLVDRVDPQAVVDDMLVTLLPGERAEITINSQRPLGPAQLLDPLVLRCANQLVHR